MGALDGLTVVELGGGIPAAYATKLLADLGATVGKAAPQRGDGLGAYLDAGKVLLDGPVDAAVVVEDLGPGGLEATGLRPRLAGSGSTWFVEGDFPGDGRVVVHTTSR